MMDGIYETDDKYTLGEITGFMEWLDKNIGTEYDLNDTGEGRFYLMIFDLSPKEVSQIREYENWGQR